MKFIDIKGDQRILYIDITHPEVSKKFEYFYPDGITKGIFKKKTYFVGEYYSASRWGNLDYYQTPQEAIKGRDNHYYVDNGKIYNPGKVKIVLRYGPAEESEFYFKNTQELISYMGTLKYKLSIDFSSLFCLETTNIYSLAEYELEGFKTGDTI